MKIINNEVTYHVEIVGEGEPLLLLHGFTGSSSTWKQTIKMLSKEYMCVMPDLVGHGQTDHPNDPTRYQIEAVAHDLRHILQELNITKVHVLGYSMGGRLALTFALLHHDCVHSLMLESASPGLALEEERTARKKSDALLAKRILSDGMAKFVDYWQNISLFQSQESLPLERKQQIRQQRLKNSEVGLANSLLGMGTGSQPSWWNELHSLIMPVLLVTGEYDEKYCTIASTMQKGIKQCEWQVIRKVGHAIHVENPEMFGKIVNEFVEKWRL